MAETIFAVAPAPPEKPPAVWVVADATSVLAAQVVREVFSLRRLGYVSRLHPGVAKNTSGEMAREIAGVMAEMSSEASLCKNKPLAALYQGYATALRGMGVKPAAQGDYLPLLLKALAHAGVASESAVPAGTVDDGGTPGGERAGGKCVGDEPFASGCIGKECPAKAPEEDNLRTVVTQKDVQARAAGDWLLPWNAVITPAARDEAARRGILLKTHNRPAKKE